MQNVFAVHRFSQGPPIGGQDRDGASYRYYSAPYTLCLFEAFPSRGNEKIRGAFLWSVDRSQVCPMVPASIVISSGGMCRYGGVDANRYNDTLSREISFLNAFLIMEA